MRKTYLSFHTEDRDNDEERVESGNLLLHRLGSALETLGYQIDYDAGLKEYDWLFASRRNEVEFNLVLSLLGTDPCRWFTWLEGDDFKALDAPAVTSEAHLVMQPAVEGHPGVSHLRWHQDNTTLREA